MSIHAAPPAYYKIAKWFKRISWIIILIPVTSLILNIVQYCKPFEGYSAGILVLSLIALAAAIFWLAFNIIMFLAAGTIRDKKSPLKIRILLSISFVMVLSMEILDVLIGVRFLSYDQHWVQVLTICLPFVVLLGYITGAILGKKIQTALE